MPKPIPWRGTEFAEHLAALGGYAWVSVAIPPKRKDSKPKTERVLARLVDGKWERWTDAEAYWAAKEFIAARYNSDPIAYDRWLGPRRATAAVRALHLVLPHLSRVLPPRD